MALPQCMNSELLFRRGFNGGDLVVLACNHSVRLKEERAGQRPRTAFYHQRWRLT